MPNTLSPATRPGLLRQLGFFSATALVISNMVGTGIFATPGFMAGDLGSAWLILACWAVGALFAFAGALSYSELGINFPSSGGEYVYLTNAFGPEWGFMTGWVSFFAGFSAPIATAALAFSDYLGYFFPSLKQANASLVIGSGAFSLRLGAGQAVASALIAVFTILNCFGVGRTAKVQNVLTSTKLDRDRRIRAARALGRQRKLEPFFPARRPHLRREPARAIRHQPALRHVRL